MEQYYPMRPIPHSCDCGYHAENQHEHSDRYDRCDRCDRYEHKSSREKQVLAMAYVPDQEFENLMTPESAFEAGTIYKDLCLPFCGKGCR